MFPRVCCSRPPSSGETAEAGPLTLDQSLRFAVGETLVRSQAAPMATRAAMADLKDGDYTVCNMTMP